MYFIRKGKFLVYVRTDYLKPVGDDKKEQPVTCLIDGDHFGEIGLVHGGKRTATVKSDNYGTLAMLKKTHFNELAKTFDKFKEAWTNQMFKYNDDLSMWLMMEMDKINYFRNLTLVTK